MSTVAQMDPRPVRHQVSAAEWQKRVDLAACYRLVDIYGMNELTSNHISTRVPGEPNAILINPHDLLFEQMHASCFTKLDLRDGSVISNPLGLKVNDAGFNIHGSILRARPDVDCIIHTHSIAGMVVSAMKRGLMPISQTSLRFTKIPRHAYLGSATPGAEMERMIRNLGDHEAIILDNHGLLVASPTISEAFECMFRLERACQVQVAALEAGIDELQLPPQEVVDKAWASSRRGGNRGPGIDWDVMLRKLDRTDTSYRD